MPCPACDACSERTRPHFAVCRSVALCYRFVGRCLPVRSRSLRQRDGSVSSQSLFCSSSFLPFLDCAADLVTKAWVFSVPELRAGHVYWLWTGHVGIQLSRNWGALFGIGQGMVWLFATLSIAAAMAIPLWLFRFGAARDAWLTFALGGVMAGVLGNLYDRLGLSGETWAGPGTRVAARGARRARLDSMAGQRRLAVAEFQHRRFATGRGCGDSVCARIAATREPRRSATRRDNSIVGRWRGFILLPSFEYRICPRMGRLPACRHRKVTPFCRSSGSSAAKIAQPEEFSGINLVKFRIF